MLYISLVKKRLIVVPGLLLLTAASSMAMSLGQLSGAALIGRPLDISVQAVLDAQTDANSLCLEADVLYGDNRLDRSRVSVSIEKSPGGPSQGLIRIRSSVPVDEPVVTFSVRAGCLLKTERRYVVFADLVPEAGLDKNTSAPVPSQLPTVVSIQPAIVPPTTTALPGEQAVTPKIRPPKRNTAPKPAPVGRVDAVRPVPADVVSAPQAQAKTPKPTPQRAPITAQVSQAEVPAKALLKLEPLEFVVEPDAQAKASAELLEKFQTLENSLRGLQAESLKARLAIDGLNAELQKAQSERYANPLVYTLVALLLVAIAGLVFLLRNRRSNDRSVSGDAPWWRKNEAYVNQQDAWRDSSSVDEQKEPGTKILSSVPKSVPVDLDLDLDFAVDKPSPESASHGVPAPPKFVDSALSAPKLTSGFGSSVHPSRAVNAEELFDVQQQADFFMSIGQHDQAIDVLQSHIAENVETSALVYLDLFNLYHQLKRPADYDSLRLNFNQRFNAEVPSFELYTDKNLGLESYQLALSRIQALWPSHKVLEIIEESLFRRPETSSEAFNLEAYRELLLLYSMAKEITNPEPKAAAVSWEFDSPDREDDRIDSQPMNFMSTAVQPLSASVDTGQPTSENWPVELSDPSQVPPLSPRLGIDIDLSKPSVREDKGEFDSVSDARFFAQFDVDAAVSKPPAGSMPLTPAKGSADTDNLIDFDAFEVPQATSVTPKRSGL